MQVQSQKAEIFWISGRNHTKKTILLDRRQTRKSDAGFIFWGKFKSSLKILGLPNEMCNKFD
jgi:hypothetical protein